MKPWLHCSALLTELSINALSFSLRPILWVAAATCKPHPIYSAAVATGVIVLLYVPLHVFSIVFSPVLLCTVFLLATLFHSGDLPMATESHQQAFASSPRNTIEATLQTDGLQGRERNRRPFSRKLFFSEHLLEQVSRASPLEIINEELEGAVVENGDCLLELFRLGLKEFEGLCYLEREIGESSSSEVVGSESPENLCFQRDEEEEDALFDITFEEDILFEIDLLAG